MKIKILVVSHDAGGANILNALVKKYKTDFNWKIYAKGPAAKIFRERTNTVKYIKKNLNINRIIEIEKPDLILTGTSWASSIEIEFLKAAKKQGIRTAVFLDHWCNYRERFGYSGNWKKNLPDIVFVGDKWAYTLALKAGFPEKKLRQVENPYLDDTIKDVKLLPYARVVKSKDNKIRILYLSEPIYEHALKYHDNPDYWGYTEYGIIKDLVKVKEICNGFLIKLRIRLHPAEKRNKYKKRGISVSNNTRLIEDCLWADIIVGGCTMALVVASMVGKKVISYIPSVKKTCPLPHKEIIKVHSFEKLIREIKLFKKNGKIKNNKNRTASDRAFLREIFNQKVCQLAE